MVRPLRLALVAATSLCSWSYAQTTINGSAFALRSSGTTSGTNATLSQNGYFGTYVTLAQPSSINLVANASGVASNGVAPNMTISIADYSQSFAVCSTSSAYNFTTPTLPAGTYFVRTQLDNHENVLVNNSPVTANTSLTLSNLQISSNASVSNTSSDANALAAANTYIDHFRKGSATVKLNFAQPGTSVHVQLTNGAFKFGTAISGGYSSTDNQLLANPAAGSTAAKFQSFINGRFNAIEPSNAGKWERNETVSLVNGTVKNVQTSAATIGDQMMAYAAAHGMTARQHNLIWGSQQPTQIQTWMTDAASTTSSTAAQSLAYAKQAIANRIVNYTQGTNLVDGHLRAADYQQMDVLNEAMQTGNYQAVLGNAGVAAIYKATQDALKAKNLNVGLYVNEYNVLQNSPLTTSPSTTFGGGGESGGDQYANWYRNEVEGYNNAGLTQGATGNVVTGIGVQYYPNSSSNKGPQYMQKALQNLSVEGLPISLTEFGGNTSIRGTTQAPQIIEDTVRMMMGTPNVNLMNIWGWYDDGTAASNPYGGGTVLVNNGFTNADGSLNLTDAGKRFEYLFGRGTDTTAAGNVGGANPDPLTTDLTLSINPDGTINFDGFYGVYTLTVNGQQYTFDFEKGGVSNFEIAVPEPTVMAIMGIMTLATVRRHRAR